MVENERLTIKLSEIPSGTPIPEGVDVINDYTTSDMEKVARTSERMHMVSLKKSDFAKRLAAASLVLSIATLVIVILFLVAMLS